MQQEIIVNLEEIRILTQQRRDEFEVMRFLLERNDELSDSEIDAIVDKVAAPIVAAIDCTQCANCCRSLDVYLTESDAQRLCDGVDIPLERIITSYVDRESGEAEGEWGKFRQRPCAFLDGNLCSVYAHRPESCRIYPVFTPDFRWTLEDLIEGAALCPIIYNVLNVMVEVTDRL